MKSQFIFLCFAMGLFSSCSSPYTYFTKRLYEEEKWTAEDVETIQFYLSKDIILTRALGGDETKIYDGKISVINGRSVERIILRAGTPGVLVHMPAEDRFAISFEQSDDEAYLMFGPSADRDYRYVLLAQEWDRHMGKVHYKDKLYTVDAESAFSSLMIDLKKEGQSNFSARRVGGRTVSN